MEGSEEEEPGRERFSTSRALDTTGSVIPSTSSFPDELDSGKLKVTKEGREDDDEADGRDRREKMFFCTTRGSPSTFVRNPNPQNYGKRATERGEDTEEDVAGRNQRERPFFYTNEVSSGIPRTNPSPQNRGEGEGDRGDEEVANSGNSERSDFYTEKGSPNISRRNPNPQNNGNGDGNNKSGNGGVDEEEAELGGREISLREWLDKADRSVERLECLHIFGQIVEMVDAAHAQGVVVHNIRPSCFVMSMLNRVSFIESASCSTSGSGSDSCEDSSGAQQSSSAATEVMEKEKGRTGKEFGGDEEKKEFPLKQILLMEFNWYTSPEEAMGDHCSFASDIYKLGVLLFELFCTFSSLEEKLRTMSSLRHRVLPPKLLLKWPKEASFCLWLLHPQPGSRPSMSEVLKSEFLTEPHSFEDHEAAIKLSEDIEDQELLLEFLLQLNQRKQEAADLLNGTICCLSSDIEEVSKQKSILKNGGSFQELDKDEQDQPLHYFEKNETSASSGSRKRFRQWLLSFHEETSDNAAEGLRSETQSNNRQSILSKSSRLMNNFKKLESVYFQARHRMIKSAGEVQNRNLGLGVISAGRGSTVRTEQNSVNNLSCKESHSGRKIDWINPFLKGLCKYLSFSKLKVRADLKQGDLLNPSNLVCSLGFDRDKEWFATAGVNRKIKVFECDTILNEDRDIHYPVVEMVSRSKLSSISWNGYIKSHIASSDFEGIVQVWDITRSKVFVEMREHERRAWCVDFSVTEPTNLASGSDDGAVKLWNINQVGSIGTIKTKANVCSVQFQPDSGHLLAVGSADHKSYCYDLRSLRVPWCTVVGHTKTVSYVKFVDSSTLVTASTDNSLKLWDLSMSSARALDDPLQTFTGHTNVKNFVGLSISDGYIATGSETNEVFVYYKAFPMPVLSFKFSSADPLSGQDVDDNLQFISSVCWRGQSSTLLAANSSGNVKLLEMV